MNFRNLFLALSVCSLAACSQKTEQKITDWQDIEKDIQTKLIMAEDGAVIELPAGNYKFKGSLSLEGKHNVTIKGAGLDKTILSWAGQTEGAEGFKVENCSNLVFSDFTIQDTKGDGIKTQKIKRITFQNMKVEWTAEPNEKNGAYGFYPVDCDSVLMDNCIAIGASDAGIYVGQSRDIIVKNCEAYHNVAGIEIENCIRADVFNNYAHENTGGLLVFDMPGLTQNGSNVRLHHNRSIDNSHRNFAPKGNIVGEVPPGTGVMILATKEVEIFENDIEKNNTIGIAIVSYKLVQQSHNDSTFNPYPKAIYVHDNRISISTFSTPSLDYDLGKLLLYKFPIGRPYIVFDGYMDPSVETKNGNYVAPYSICIGDNGGAKFAAMDAPNEFKNMTTDRTNFDCTLSNLTPVNL